MQTFSSSRLSRVSRSSRTRESSRVRAFSRVRTLVVAGVAASALLLAACGSSGGGAGSAQGGAGSPAKGGTLKIVSTGDIDHLAPTSAGITSTANVERAISRTLLSYQSSTDEAARIVVKPDLATEVPQPSADGLSYAMTLRDGAKWDAPGGARQVTSEDVARGIKMMCNPTLGSPHAGYFLNLVKGLQSFCDGFSKVNAQDAAAEKAYVEGHQVPGIDTSDPKTVKFTLTQKAGDFVYMLTLVDAAPEPVESLDYLTDSPDYRSHFVADGPYTVDAYKPDQSLSFKRNPAWDPKSDPLRKAYVDKIQITMGVQPDAAMQQLQSGDADMTYDITIPTATLQQLTTAKDPKLVKVNAGIVDPFLWMNTKTDNNNGALKKLKVRQALEYAVDKASVVQTLGGSVAAAVNNGIFGPGVIGYHQFDPYPTPGNGGDPAKAKQMLADAGYPNGLTLKMPYQTQDPEQSIAQTLQASFKKAGVTLQLIPVSPGDFYPKYMTNRQNTADGKWDIAPVGWQPDWVGGAARSVFQPQFSYTGTPQTYNYMDYNNDKANDLAAQAIASADPAQSAKLWGQVDETVMADAPIIPIASRITLLYHSERVQDFLPFALSSQGDWTNLWLES